MAKLTDTGVYVIRSTIDGKIYIGSASLSIERRWRVHKSLLRCNKHHSKHLQRAYNKYGEGNFTYNILILCEPSQCVELEQHYLDTYKSYDNEIGYNVSQIAGSQLGYKHTKESKNRMKGPKTENHKAKLKLSRMQQKFSLISIAKMRVSHSGHTVSEETKEKLRQKATGRKLSKEVIEHRKIMVIKNREKRKCL